MIPIMIFITKVVGNLKNNVYICIMSLIKRWIEEEMMKGNDVLHLDYQSNYDEYEYEQWSYNQQKKEEDTESKY